MRGRIFVTHVLFGDVAKIAVGIVVECVHLVDELADLGFEKFAAEELVQENADQDTQDGH